MLILLAACTVDPAGPSDPSDTDDLDANTVQCTSTGDGALDFGDACADGLCADVDQNYSAVQAQWGDGTCVQDPMVDNRVWCTFANHNGVSVRFPGLGGVPTADDHDMFDWQVLITAPFAGTDSNGLGLDAPLACFEHHLGAATSTAYWEFVPTTLGHSYSDLTVIGDPATALQMTWGYDE
jgi:hypothetical protein